MSIKDDQLCLYLFEELQLNSVLKELSHGTGTMIHKCFFIEIYWLPLKINKVTSLERRTMKKHIMDEPNHPFYQILDRQWSTFSKRLFSFSVTKTVTGNLSCHKPLECTTLFLCLTQKQSEIYVPL